MCICLVVLFSKVHREPLETRVKFLVCFNILKYTNTTDSDTFDLFFLDVLFLFSMKKLIIFDIFLILM